MTDKANNFEKDINVPSKEHINDSLKNSDKNFNENFTQEKEQIIIDGVDVKNCKGIDLGLFPLAKCKFLKFKTSDGGIAGIWCSDHTNCYYKQLKRKEKEYEELRQYHNKCCEEFENEKQKLIDKYNQFSKDFFIGKYCKKEYCELLKAKEQECEELKERKLKLELIKKLKKTYS